MDNIIDVIAGGLASRAVWAVLISFSALFGIGFYHKERRKFAGKWRMSIQWSHEHAIKLFGDSVAEPYSVGDLSVSYGFGPNHDQYWGLAYFELFSGTQRYAHLCVELEDMLVERRWFSLSFPFVGRTELRSLNLRALIRKPLETFDYGPWARYSMKFDDTSARDLLGHMVLVETGEIVGTVTANRTR